MNYELFHVGVGHDDGPPGRGSGRWPYGSGENPFQHQYSFTSEVTRLRKEGNTDSQIARLLLGQKGVRKDGTPIWYTSADLKARYSIEYVAERQVKRARVLKLYDECHGNVSEVGRRMGINESSVRSLLDTVIDERTKKYQNTADYFKEQIAKNEMIDVSSGSELHLGVTDYTKKVAISMLEQEGYIKTWVQMPQAGSDKKTTTMVLARPPKEGETPADVYRMVQQNKYNIAPIREFSSDGGKTFWTPEFPEMLDSKRVMVRYAEDGGVYKDGVIELKRGVKDISLGDAQYAQVRIAMDGTNYLKGMAMYADDSAFPKGVDVIFNTNKHKGTPLIDTEGVYDPKTNTWNYHEVSKRLKVDADGNVDQSNPFGALMKTPKDRDGVLTAAGQSHYIGDDGQEHLSVINKLRDEGDWDSWSKTLSSQFLSKQPMKLINQQLNLSVLDKKTELESIESLTNPVIKKKLLDEFADNCDSIASDLSAVGFKGQAYQVLLPMPKLKETEIYAPNYKDGDTVALVRYPHGGVFEIPILTVNNRNPEAQRVLGKTTRDAVGINHKVAEQLSGADFDGDTALVIPVKSNRLTISARPYLEALKRFDPKEQYKLPDSAPKMKNKTKQTEMGKVTNLITDMTVGGADFDEITRAVKHSMVVIDAEKHHLDYKQSAIDNDIDALKRKYQGVNSVGQAKGASTILSRASASARINKRKEITDTSKMTPEELKSWNAGNKVYRDTGETIIKRITDPTKMTQDELKRYNEGKKVYRDTGKPKQVEIPQMYIHDDAMELVRNPNNQKEVAYAKYANSLKDLGRQARKEARNIKPYQVSQEAKVTYAKEVESLDAKLRTAEKNAPIERQAQRLAGSWLSEKSKSNPDMDSEHRKREEALAITKARAAVGAKKEPVKITDREWEAIQAHAITTNKLERILNNTDQDAFKKRALPKQTSSLTSAQISKIKAMASSGMYTNADIAESLGVSSSTISAIISGEKG